MQSDSCRNPTQASTNKKSDLRPGPEPASPGHFAKASLHPAQFVVGQEKDLSRFGRQNQTRGCRAYQRTDHRARRRKHGRAETGSGWK